MLDRILIDPQAFAEKGETLQGQVLLKDLDTRVLSSDIVDDSAAVSYHIQGGLDKWQRPFFDLSLSGSILLRCQRCLGEMPFALEEDCRIVLFDNEDELDKAMLADEELDGMLVESECDVFSLLEDQILMALPFSALHDACDDADLTASDQDKPNPFAVLAGLKKSD